jgi:hypothetical protein
MKQTIEISDDLAVLVQQYLQKNPSLTLSDLIQEALVQKIASEQLEENSTTTEVSLPNSEQIEKFMALSGIVQYSPRHSDEHAEDYVD